MGQGSRAARLGRALGALATALMLCALGAAPAGAADVALEAETLSPAGAQSQTPSDPNASGGRALRLLSNGAAEGSVTTSESSVHLFIRARGENCFGSPTLSVTIDGLERWRGPVGTGAYWEAGARMSIPAGRHRVSVAMSDDHRTALCDRNVWIDKVTVIGQPFHPRGWRNRRLPKDAPIARYSKAMVASLRAQISEFHRGAGVGTTQYSVPVYVVPRDQPTVRVFGPPVMGSQWDAVPLPPDARPAAGNDAHLTVWQPSTDTLWEFWGLRRNGGRWSALFGGRIQNVSRNKGSFENPPGRGFGASSSSIALLAGLQRIEELRRGVIDHAVDFAVVPRYARDGWCWPAHRTNPQAASRAKGTIPGGARFRLPARFDLKAYARKHSLSRYAVIVARAVQRYGFVVRDAGGQPGFYAEDPGPLGWNPYPEIFQGLAPDSHGVLMNFPWHKLQVVAPPGRSRGCTDDPDPD